MSLVFSIPGRGLAKWLNCGREAALLSVFLLLISLLFYVILCPLKTAWSGGKLAFLLQRFFAFLLTHSSLGRYHQPPNEERKATKKIGRTGGQQVTRCHAVLSQFKRLKTHREKMSEMSQYRPDLVLQRGRSIETFLHVHVCNVCMPQFFFAYMYRIHNHTTCISPQLLSIIYIYIYIYYYIYNINTVVDN